MPERHPGNRLRSGNGVTRGIIRPPCAVPAGATIVLPVATGGITVAIMIARQSVCHHPPF
ncbi:hypothetical protein GCM10009834_27630 [Streptomonospora arabica]